MAKEYGKKPIQDRFMAKVSVPNDPNACWKWKGVPDKKGYGFIWVNSKNALAHRLSYKLFCGEIAKGMCVCHKCDNPGCVNPKHLFLGTQKENMADMIQKGRSNKAKGSKNGRAKLKEDDIQEIRKMIDSELTLTQIAKQFNVSQWTISRIKRGNNWSHVS
jgi:hypothetical protein